MANKNSKSAGNVSGKYYVDTNCIGCGQCVDTAFDFFSEGSDGNMYVKAQPTSKESIELCEKALADCPIGAIGNDG
jgi:ferredoxin